MTSEVTSLKEGDGWNYSSGCGGEEKFIGESGQNICLNIVFGGEISTVAACMNGSTINWDVEEQFQMSESVTSLFGPLHHLFLASDNINILLGQVV